MKTPQKRKCQYGGCNKETAYRRNNISVCKTHYELLKFIIDVLYSFKIELTPEERK
jgi:hypothetical protein